MNELHPRLAAVVVALTVGCAGPSPRAFAPPEPAGQGGSIERHIEYLSSASQPSDAGASDAESPDPPGAAPAIAIRPSAAEMTARQWEHVASVDGVACRAELASEGVRFTSLADVAAPNRVGCGVPHGVVVTRGPTGIAYAPPLLVDCSLARELASVERIVQEEADRHLGTPIVRIATLGTFSCRHRRGRWEDTLSEHSFGDAADLASFEPKKGRAIAIARDYELGKTAFGPRASFLRAVYARLRGETKLTFVLGPEFNPEHRDHFHIDSGYRWW